MSEQNEQQPAEPGLASFEGNLFGTLLGFHKKTMSLLRNSELKDDEIDLVADRISGLYDKMKVEITQTPGFDLAKRLETAYDEIERLVDELSDLHGDGEEA